MTGFASISRAVAETSGVVDSSLTANIINASLILKCWNNATSLSAESEVERCGVVETAVGLLASALAVAQVFHC